MDFIHFQISAEDMERLIQELRETVRPHGAIHTAKLNEVWAALNVVLERRGKRLAREPEFARLVAETKDIFAPILPALSGRRSSITSATVRQMTKHWYVSATALLSQLDEIRTSTIETRRQRKAETGTSGEEVTTQKEGAGVETTQVKPSTTKEVSNLQTSRFFIS